MCPCCSGSENVNDLDNFFDEKYQFRAANKYLQNGLDKESQRLIRWVADRLDGSQTIMEIGCGAGMIHHDLLRKEKVAHAVGIDVSTAGIKAATQNAEKFQLSEKIDYHKVDFAQNADQFQSADFVVMDRVICCYPFLDLLLGQAAEKTGKYLAISFPVENFLSKLAIRTCGTCLRWFGQTFHPFLHGHANIRSTAEAAGLRLAHQDRHFIWSMMIFERLPTQR